MTADDWVAISAITAAAATIVAAAAAVASWRAASAARKSAEATEKLVGIEADRRRDEQTRSASSRGLVAHERTSSQAPFTRVIRLFNVGPGSAVIETVEIEQENGGSADGVNVVFSDAYPIELRRGEYTRIDLSHAMASTRYRLKVTYEDGAGTHSGYRVRTQLRDEHAIPLEG